MSGVIGTAELSRDGSDGAVSSDQAGSLEAVAAEAYAPGGLVHEPTETSLAAVGALLFWCGVLIEVLT